MQTQSFDYVVIGGGSAGCVVASRLSEDPDSSDLIQAPLGFAATAALGLHNWNYNTVPQPGLNGRRGLHTRQPGLGV